MTYFLQIRSESYSSNIHFPCFIFLLFFEKFPGSIVLQSLPWSTRRNNIYDTNTIVRAHRDRQIINDRLIKKNLAFYFPLRKAGKARLVAKTNQDKLEMKPYQIVLENSGKNSSLFLSLQFFSHRLLQNTRAQSTRADNSQVQEWLGKLIIMNLN